MLAHSFAVPFSLGKGASHGGVCMIVPDGEVIALVGQPGAVASALRQLVANGVQQQQWLNEQWGVRKEAKSEWEQGRGGACPSWQYWDAAGGCRACSVRSEGGSGLAAGLGTAQAGATRTEHEAVGAPTLGGQGLECPMESSCVDRWASQEAVQEVQEAQEQGQEEEVEGHAFPDKGDSCDISSESLYGPECDWSAAIQPTSEQEAAGGPTGLGEGSPPQGAGECTSTSKQLSVGVAGGAQVQVGIGRVGTSAANTVAVPPFDVTLLDVTLAPARAAEHRFQGALMGEEAGAEDRACRSHQGMGSDSLSQSQSPNKTQWQGQLQVSEAKNSVRIAASRKIGFTQPHAESPKAAERPSASAFGASGTQHAEEDVQQECQQAAGTCHSLELCSGTRTVPSLRRDRASQARLSIGSPAVQVQALPQTRACGGSMLECARRKGGREAVSRACAVADASTTATSCKAPPPPAPPQEERATDEECASITNTAAEDGSTAARQEERAIHEESASFGWDSPRAAKCATPIRSMGTAPHCGGMARDSSRESHRASGRNGGLYVTTKVVDTPPRAQVERDHTELGEAPAWSLGLGVAEEPPTAHGSEQVWEGSGTATLERLGKLALPRPPESIQSCSRRAHSAPPKQPSLGVPTTDRDWPAEQARPPGLVECCGSGVQFVIGAEESAEGSRTPSIYGEWKDSQLAPGGVCVSEPTACGVGSGGGPGVCSSAGEGRDDQPAEYFERLIELRKGWHPSMVLHWAQEADRARAREVSRRLMDIQVMQPP